MPRPRARLTFGHAAAWRERRSRLVLALVAAALLASAFFAVAARFGERDERPLEATGARAAADARVEAPALCVDVEASLLDPLSVQAALRCAPAPTSTPPSTSHESGGSHAGDARTSPRAPPDHPPGAPEGEQVPDEPTADDAASPTGPPADPAAANGSSADTPEPRSSARDGADSDPRSSPRDAADPDPGASGAAEPVSPSADPEGPNAPEDAYARWPDDANAPSPNPSPSPSLDDGGSAHPAGQTPPSRDKAGPARVAATMFELARRAWDASASPAASPPTGGAEPARGETPSRCADPSPTCAGTDDARARAWSFPPHGPFSREPGAGDLDRGLLERLAGAVARYLRVG